MLIFTYGALTSVLDFLLIHLSQLLTHCSVSDVIPGQKNLSCNTDMVLSLLG